VKKIRLFVAATLLVTNFLGLAGTAQAKSGWIDGDQDEIHLPRANSQQQQNLQQNQQQNQQQNLQKPPNDSDDNPPPSSSGRGYQSAGSDQSNDPSMGSNSVPAPTEGSMDKAGNPLDSYYDLDSRPVETSKLTIHEGGSNVITGGVTSANFRSARTMNRGTDEKAATLMERAPSYSMPRTVAVQPGTFKGFLDRNHTGEASNLSKTTIVEIKGQWDDCGHIIHSFGLPFTRISPTAVVKADLSKTKVLIVNCGANFDGDALSTIREFVAHGGFLMTTDWALDSCLQKAFPGYVEWNGGYTDNSVVDAVIVDRDPELTKGVPRSGYWKLEDKSQTVQVIRKMEVQVLVRSAMLMNREPSQLGILALTFPYGDGQILHLVGHFDNNADRAFNNALPDPAPIIGIAIRQAIAANFIMAAAREGGAVSPPTAKADGN
jgi:hypothetical protein